MRQWTGSALVSDNGLSPDIWTNVVSVSIGSLGTNSSESSIKIHRFSVTKIHFKMPSAKCVKTLRPEQNGQHFEDNWTKWLTFCRQHFQMQIIFLGNHYLIHYWPWSRTPMASHDHSVLTINIPEREICEGDYGEIAGHSPNFNEVITTTFCTWHNSCAAVPCAQK